MTLTVYKQVRVCKAHSQAPVHVKEPHEAGSTGTCGKKEVLTNVCSHKANNENLEMAAWFPWSEPYSHWHIERQIWYLSFPEPQFSLQWRDGRLWQTAGATHQLWVAVVISLSFLTNSSSLLHFFVFMKLKKNYIKIIYCYHYCIIIILVSEGKYLGMEVHSGNV